MSTWHNTHIIFATEDCLTKVKFEPDSRTNMVTIRLDDIYDSITISGDYAFEFVTKLYQHFLSFEVL